jgi:hypothetical protein
VIWVMTTPVDCLDHFRCTVYEMNGAARTEVASDVFLLQHVSGEYIHCNMIGECRSTQ